MLHASRWTTSEGIVTAAVKGPENRSNSRGPEICCCQPGYSATGSIVQIIRSEVDRLSPEEKFSDVLAMCAQDNPPVCVEESNPRCAHMWRSFKLHSADPRKDIACRRRARVYAS